MMKLALSLAVAVLPAFCAARAATADYLRDVKPLLAEQCYKCHGAAQQKSGLRLDTTAFALKGGNNGPAFTPGDSKSSLLVQAVEGAHKEIPRMPYKKPALSPSKIALLKSWIDAGAPAPKDEQPEKSKHWAFSKPKRSPLPKVKQAAWVQNPIDAFILARLEKEKVAPSPEADRVTLIRRLSLDLLGLPPTPAEVDAFVNDTSSDAYKKLVERLLASPHYGERWGRWWLDAARYADSNGYSIDAPRQIWRYRDWVIDVMNRDMPFDQFTIEQLAGDMLPNATMGQKIATGFHRNTQINQEGGIDKEQFRIESIIDRVNTTASAWLGLTFGCAQCHDHKFDPFSQREYYEFFAFLNNADEPDLPLSTPDESKRAEEIEAKISGYIANLLKTDVGIIERELKWEKSLTPEQSQALSQAVREVFPTPPAQRTEAQKLVVVTTFVETSAENKTHQAALKKLRAAKPVVQTTMVMRERDKQRRTYLFIKGDFTRDGGDVKPGVPSALHALKKSDGLNRLDLARWLVDAENPLTARVIVNRVWQQYFGKGIVETENDFGTQGIPPSHPQLLDWLACEFMSPTQTTGGAPATAWSLKHLHRLIVNSATYRQSSHVRPELNLIDANNKLLARQNRLRLDAEVVRDVCLAASGLLSKKMGGPSVYPPIPDGVMSLGQVKRPWTPSDGADRYRRGLYTFYFRATPHPLLNVFDAPDAFSACTRRIRSNTPLQSLTLLNDAAFYEFAQALAARVLKEGSASDEAKLDHAFRLCLARKPSPNEKQRLNELLAHELATEQGDKKQLAAWTTVARVLLNLDETITRE